MGKIKHDMSRTATYRSWSSMHRRCTNPSNMNYMYYGGRGIKVCERWNDFTNFYQDMGERPSNCSLDRIDNNKDYEPNNCKWATRREQCNNRRNNRNYTYKGRTQTLNQWANELQINETTLSNRLEKKLSVDEAFEKEKRTWPKYTYKGRTQTITQWANELHIPYTVLGYRIKKLKLSVEEAFEKGFKRKCVSKYTYKGRTQTLTQWANELQINRDTLDYRIKKLKLSVKEAFEKALDLIQSKKAKKEEHPPEIRGAIEEEIAAKHSDYLARVREFEKEFERKYESGIYSNAKRYEEEAKGNYFMDDIYPLDMTHEAPELRAKVREEREQEIK